MWDDISKEKKQKELEAFEKRQKELYPIGKWIFIATVGLQIIFAILFVVVFGLLGNDNWVAVIVKLVLLFVLVPLSLFVSYIQHEEYEYIDVTYRISIAFTLGLEGFLTFMGLLFHSVVSISGIGMALMVAMLIYDGVACALFTKSQAVKTFFHYRFDDF